MFSPITVVSVIGLYVLSRIGRGLDIPHLHETAACLIIHAVTAGHTPDCTI
jgi:hypothetical protein